MTKLESCHAQKIAIYKFFTYSMSEEFNAALVHFVAEGVRNYAITPMQDTQTYKAIANLRRALNISHEEGQH